MYIIETKGSWIKDRGVNVLYKSRGHGRYCVNVDWMGFSASAVQLFRGGRRLMFLLFRRVRDD